MSFIYEILRAPGLWPFSRAFSTEEHKVKRYLIAASLLVLPACSESKDSDQLPIADNPTPINPGASAPVSPGISTPTTSGNSSAPSVPVFEVREQSLDATQKGLWIYHGLKDDELVPMTKDEPWIIGTSRYLWQTNTGSSGSSTGGVYEVSDQAFDDISRCENTRYVQDIMVPPLGSVSEEMTAKWFDIAATVPEPLDITFVIGRDNECLKLKLLSYDKGLYTLKFQRLQ
jgi:hypothetical protein